ncbi:MAG: PAS domain S-box protein [Gammaproteobacteria bacterium]|nr:MAG: PAS domain S-box protein [Gammaproteobacteria bacterium]
MYSGFKLVEKLHKSNRTQVYRGIRESDNATVIIKSRERAIYGSSRKDLQREFEIGKLVSNSQVVNYISFEETADAAFIVMHDDKMVALSSRIPVTGFDVKTFLDLAIDISSALLQIHNAGVVHKDINPENIIINGTLNNIKIIDFGLASRFVEERADFAAPNILQGRLSYISPEQTGRVNKPVDHRSDLYSLGITFYQLLIGKLPFDDDDQGKLIYDHIATLPSFVSDINSEIHGSIGKVIGKLLNKSPSERYQTCSTLIEDLRYIQSCLSKKKSLDDFDPGSADIEEIISMSGHIYGRGKEISTLITSLECCSESTQLITVSGNSGVGKTSLIRELYVPITKKDGFFLSGKFDQFSSKLSYTVIFDILKDFLIQIETDNSNDWKGIINSSIGDFGQIFLDIIPELSEILGEQEKHTLPDLSPQELLFHRNRIFARIICNLSIVGRPIVLFIDDLQWADSESIALIEEIIGFGPKNLLMILSYRNDEITSVSPINSFLECPARVGVTCNDIALSNLNQLSIQDWIKDLVPCADEKVKTVAELVYAKTEGNPLYLTSIFQQIFENKFIYKGEGGEIFVDLDAIADLPADSDVVFFLIGRINSLDEITREFLIELSILGRSFTVSTIEQIFSSSRDNLRQLIISLIELHLIVRVGDKFKFVHDRVLQAVRGQISSERFSNLNLKFGKIIKANLVLKGMQNEYIEEYIDYFNNALSCIKDETDRIELHRLNISLGQRLKANAAFQAAENYYQYAISFLPDNSSAEDNDSLAFLLMEYGEILFLTHKYDRGEVQFKKAVELTQYPQIKGKIYSKQILHYGYQNESEKAIGIARNALQDLGIILPEKYVKIHFYKELIKIFILLKGKRPETILDMPQTDDVKVIAQMDLLSAASGIAYISYPEMWPLIILKMIEITISNGLTVSSPLCLISFSILLCNMGFIEHGYSAGKAALEYLERVNATKMIPIANHRFAMGVSQWKDPLSESLRRLEIATTKGLETGNFEYASLALYNKMRVSFYAGENIDALLREFPNRHQQFEAMGKKHSVLMGKHWNQFLITLNSLTGDGKTVSGDLIEEEWLLDYLKTSNSVSGYQFCMFAKLQLAFLARDFKLANKLREENFESIVNVFVGTIYIPIAHFFNALVCIQVYREIEKSKRYVNEAKRSLCKLQKWAKKAPENILNKSQLIEAELQSLENPNIISLYQQSIDNALINNNFLDAGMASELMGRSLINSGFQSLGVVKIQEAIEIFEDWGAGNKSARLRTEFAEVDEAKDHLTHSDSSGSSQDIYDRIDLRTLAGTITSFSGNLNLNSLLESLLQAVMQNSGATRVIYIHSNGEGITVRAAKKNKENIVIYPEGQRLALFNLPINLVERTQDDISTYIIDNVITTEGHEEDKKSKLKSVLLIPLVMNGVLKGIIYLENDLMENAFRPEQVKFLTLLSGQAVIALDNASAFEKLESERTYSTSIIMNSPSLICGINADGNTTFVNPTVEKITGYSKDELIGQNWWRRFYPGEKYKQVEQLFDDITKGEVTNYQMELTCSNGNKRLVLWNSFTKRDANNQIVEIIGFGNDITEQKKAENEALLRTNQLSQANKELTKHKEHLQDLVDERTVELKSSLEELQQAQDYIIQSEKMSALGGLVAGVAHEINTPVSIGVTAASHLEDRTKATLNKYKDGNLKRSDLEEYFGIVNDSSRMVVMNMRRAADLIQSFKQVAVDQSSEVKRNFKLLEYLEEILLSLHSEINKNGLEVLLNCPKGIVLNTYPGALSQVMTNLIMNSIIHGFDDKDNGIISINVKEIDENISITYKDNGKGIEEEYLNKIYDPFFTTKRGSGGSGLGMHIVYNLVTQTLCGDINCLSQEAEGVVFDLRIPKNI